MISFDVFQIIFFPAVILLGYALATSQFCMVRAVLSLKNGFLSPIRCLLGISFSIGYFVALTNFLIGNRDYYFIAPSPKIVLSGILFGLAARFNGGCYIGTMNYLGRGHLRRIYTVLGCIIGFILVDSSSSETIEYSDKQILLTLLSMGVLLLLAEMWALKTRQEFIPNVDLPELKGIWASALMLSIGLIIGLLIYLKLPYQPSAMAHNVGRWLKGLDFSVLSLSALMMPLGMMLFHKGRNNFAILPLTREDIKLILWGVVMALSTIWGAGGNDGYLFESLPKGSLHAIVGLLGMSVGIVIAENFNNKRNSTRQTSK